MVVVVVRTVTTIAIVALHWTIFPTIAALTTFYTVYKSREAAIGEKGTQKLY